MKKKIGGIILGVLALASFAFYARAGVSFFAKVISEAGLTYAKRYVFDLNNLPADRVSVEMVYTSTSAPAINFGDGQPSTGSLTVSSFTALTEARAIGSITISTLTAMSGTSAYATITVTSNTVLGGTLGYDQIIVTGDVTNMTSTTTLISSITFNTTRNFTIFGSTQSAQNLVNDFSITGTSVSVATGIANAINTHFWGIRASTVGWGNIVNIVTVSSGFFSNNWTITSGTQSTLVVLNSSFTGGSDPAIFSVNGTSWQANADWFVGRTSTDTAVSIANVLTNNGAELGIYASTTSDAVVTLLARRVGSYLNKYTLASSTPTALASSATFVGGADPVYFIVNGRRFNAGIDWIPQLTTTDTARVIATALQKDPYLSSTTVLISTWSTIWVSTGQVNLTSVSTGTAYQYGLFSSSQAVLTLSGNVATNPNGTAISTMTGGIDYNYFSINGVKLYQGATTYQWIVGRTSTDTAVNISSAINNNPTLSKVVLSSWTTVSSLGVVTVTATVVGQITNYLLYSSTQAALTVSNNISTTTPGIQLNYGIYYSSQVFASTGTAWGQMQGGIDSQFNQQTEVITSTNFFTLGMAVLYSTPTGLQINPLVSQTTYFITNVTTNSFQLAYTATGAIAGIAVNLISTPAISAINYFTLTPLSFTGAANITWQVSNDTITANWVNLGVGSGTVYSTTVSSYQIVDLGVINFRYLSANISSPTAGGFNLNVWLNGKQ
jgi:hypothetical protein